MFLEIILRHLVLFFGQGLSYMLIVINVRAATKGKYAMTAGSDFLIGIVGFYLIQRIAAAGSWHEMLAYALGGSSGSVLAIWLTKHWDKESA
jgi:hypothetical protein